MRKPFDLATAIKHPERVRSETFPEDSAVRVIHVPEANEDNRVLVVWSDGDTTTLTEDGRAYTTDKNPVLFLESEPELVPWSNLDEIPDGVWFRSKNEPGLHLRLLATSGLGEVRFRNTWWSLDSLLREFEYSKTHAGPWFACGKQV